MRTVAVTPVVGLPTFTDWSQVVEVIVKSGVCVYSFSLVGQSASVLGRELVSDLDEESPKNAQDLYDLVLDLIERTRSKNCTLSISAALVRGKSIDLVAKDGSILLKRGRKIGTLISQTSETSVLTGTFETEDVLVLATSESVQFIPELVQQFERGLTTEAVVSAILPALRNDADLASASLAFVVASENLETEKVSAKLEPEKPVVSEPPEVEEIGTEDAELVVPVGQVFMPPISEEPKESFWKRILVLAKAGKNLLISLFQLIVKIRLKMFGNVRDLLPSKSVYIRTSQQAVWRRRVIVAASVLALLLMVVVGTRWWYLNQLAQARSLLEPLQSELSDAQNQLATDPIVARQRVEAVVAEFKSLAAINARKPIIGPEIAAALAEAEQVGEDVSGTKEVTQLPVFYDLRLAQSDFIVTESHFINDQGVFVDTEKKQVLVLDLETKQILQLSLSDLSAIKATAIFGNDLLALSGGLQEVTLESDAKPKEIKAEGDSNRDGTFIASFGSYAYILNPVKRNFYRYLISETTVSDPVGWLVDPLDVSYDSITSIAIDGDVWFATNEGELKKYSSGRKAQFEAKGMPTDFSSPIYVSAAEDLEKLYILEPSQNRIVILDKTGAFVKEITSSSISTVTSMFVDGSGKMAYLSSGSLVYQVDLEQ